MKNQFTNSAGAILLIAKCLKAGWAIATSIVYDTGKPGSPLLLVAIAGSISIVAMIGVGLMGI